MCVCVYGLFKDGKISFADSFPASEPLDIELEDPRILMIRAVLPMDATHTKLTPAWLIKPAIQRQAFTREDRLH